MFVMGWCQRNGCNKPFVAHVVNVVDVTFLDKTCSKTCKASRKRTNHRRNRQQLDERCNKPKKYAWATIEDALQGVLKISPRVGKPLYPYQCECGRWHLTQERKKRNKWATQYPEIYAQLPVHMPL